MGDPRATLAVGWTASVLPDGRVEITDGAVSVVLPIEAVHAAAVAINALAQHIVDTGTLVPIDSDDGGM